jgi:hypothetical protein
MIATVRLGALVGLVVFCVACDPQQPTPLGRSAPPTAPTPPAPPSGPPLSGPSTTYHFSAPLDKPVSSYTQTSSFVLYNNGAFAIRYEEVGAYGSYRQEDASILFDLAADGKARSSAGRTLSERSTATCWRSDIASRCGSAPISRTLFTDALSELIIRGRIDRSVPPRSSWFRAENVSGAEQTTKTHRKVASASYTTHDKRRSGFRYCAQRLGG